jgi:hypothetical protein
MDASIQRGLVSLEQGQPFEEDEWVRRTVKELKLEHTIRPDGPPPRESQLKSCQSARWSFSSTPSHSMLRAISLAIN